jgi:lipopolysaccharide/colanic/teichoic acid biosynthesis glycosyltransferase
MRVGWRENPITVLKFRSMNTAAESNGEAQWASQNDPRVTRVGRWLRKLRLDELPQLLNILVGEMSFIGPRPERPEFVRELKETIPLYHLRHYAVPGLTGWAQVKFPYGASFEDSKRKLEYDLYYILHASPGLDLRVLAKTIKVVLLRQGSR